MLRNLLILDSSVCVTFLSSLETWIKGKKVLESWPFWEISGFLSFQVGKLKQRVFEHQFFEPKAKNHSRAGNQILSCRAIQVSIFLTRAFFQLAHKRELWKMFLWVGWRLCYTDLITWLLAAQPFDVLRKWLIMTGLLGLVTLIFTVFLKSQILDAETSFWFKWNLKELKCIFESHPL